MPKVVYSNKFIPKRFAGITYQIPFTKHSIIIIRPKYKKDEGLLIHELTHAKQIENDIFWNIKYNFKRKNRLCYEVEAFKNQMNQYYNEHLDFFAKFLAENYNLKISIEEAKKYLSGDKKCK